MKIVTVIGFCLMASSVVFAGEKHAHESHKHHGTHEHGVAELLIAVEGSGATVMMKSPTETVFGFEHVAKTAEEKQKEAKVSEALKNELQSVFVLEAALECQFKNTALKILGGNEGHRDLQSEWQISCAKPLTGTQVEFKFSKLFPRIHELRVTLVSDQKQIEREFKRGNGKLSF